MLCDKVKCTGCLACVNSCNLGAISIAVDDLGKTYPKIDEIKCIACLQCESVCPILNPLEKRVPVEVYAAWSMKEDDRAKSSSGGLGTVFARKVILTGGVVCGAAVTDGTVKHIIVDTIEDLDKLRGSKYVQSDMNSVYKDIKKLLNTGRKVLFIGTPCQAAGLRRYVRGKEDNLLVVDLICHGVPPYVYLKKYLSEVSQPYDSFSFRGTNDYHLTTYKDNEILYKQSKYEDFYFQAFLNGLILRDNCYKCEYASKERISDITIGDFWGLDRSTLEHPYEGKISVMLVCSEKGKAFINQLDEKTFIMETRTIEEAVNEDQTNLIRPSNCPKERTSFEAKYRKYGFTRAVAKTNIGRKVHLRRIRKWALRRIKNKGE